MLLKAHGSKLLPVDTAQVAKQRRQQDKYEEKREQQRSVADKQKPEEPNE